MSFWTYLLVALIFGFLTLTVVITDLLKGSTINAIGAFLMYAIGMLLIAVDDRSH